MIRRVIGAATFRRDAYLRAVLSPNAAADGLMVVAAVYLVLAVAILPFNVVDYGRWVLSGLWSWLLLSGAIYLIGKHLLEGFGSFPGMLAVTAFAHPVLAVLLIARLPGLPDWLTLVVSTVWFLAILVAGTRVALELITEKALVAVAGGYVVWLILSRFLV
ncbi:YIP1 family protein [bacterium]|nr:YIP1 family protein [bacterium]